MRVSVLGSIFLHVFILLFTVLSLPLFNNNDLEMPPVIQVELIEIAEKTNVPQISKKIEEQKEPVEKKKEETKLNQPISKPKDEKSNEKVKDPSDEEKIEKTKLEEKMIQNMPVRKPEVKKKDKFDPLKLAELIDKQKDTKIYVRGDEAIDYGQIMRVLGELSGSGFTKVALITKPLSK